MDSVTYHVADRGFGMQAVCRVRLVIGSESPGCANAAVEVEMSEGGVECVVERWRYEAAVGRKWKKGDKCQVRGVIEGRGGWWLHQGLEHVHSCPGSKQ